MALSDFFSSFKSTIYADSEEKEPEAVAEAAEEEEEEPEDVRTAFKLYSVLGDLLNRTL